MREFVADEDVPRPIVEKLRSRAFKIFYIEEEMKSSTDERVLEKPVQLDIPVLTFDNDFFQFSSHPGVLHITQRTNYDQVVNAVEDVVMRLQKSEVEDSVIRINPGHYTS